MKIQLKRHLVIEFRLTNGIRHNVGCYCNRCVTLSTNSKTVITKSFKGTSNNHGRLHPQLAWMGAVLQYHGFECNQKGNQENGHIILPFLGLEHLSLGRNRSRVGVGVRFYIFRPESHLKFVDSAALLISHQILHQIAVITRHFLHIWTGNTLVKVSYRYG